MAVAVAMAMTGMPNPILWSVAAALLNFVPYIGAIGECGHQASFANRHSIRWRYVSPGLSTAEGKVG
jgi:hypothetical protein